MSRTYRHRHALPRDWTVRDDGCLWYKGVDRWGDTWRDEEPGRELPDYRGSYYNKERTDIRRWWNRLHRAKVRNLIRKGRYEGVQAPRRTSGWLSW